MQNHANNVAGELPEISLRLLPASAAISGIGEHFEGAVDENGTRL